MLSSTLSLTVPGPASEVPAVAIAAAASPLTEGVRRRRSRSAAPGRLEAALTVTVAVTESGAMLAGTSPTAGHRRCR